MKPTGMVAVLLLVTQITAYAQTPRDVFDDFDTQMPGSEHIGAIGPNPFGESTDLYSGATAFLVTDASLPGNSDLTVAVQRSLEAFDSGLGFSPHGMPSTFLTWTRFEVPYLSSIFKQNDGWRSVIGHTPSQLRCSVTSGPPEVTQTAGKDATWESFEYWHGNQLYLPGSGPQLMSAVADVDPNQPTDGSTYYWVTKDRWYFSCLPQTANGVPGEGFLARAPDGKKYWFDWIVDWRAVSELRKFVQNGPDADETVLSRDEYRILLTRVEDRFGNWVEYTYSGKDLASIRANDGRRLTLTYAAPGGAVTSVSDGSRTWTYDYSSGVQVTFPDSTVWRATVDLNTIRRSKPLDCRDEQIRYLGQAVVTIQIRSGAVGTFTFFPLRRGLSYVGNPGPTCPNFPRYVDNIALYAKSITGSGLTESTWAYNYGPPNGCYIFGSFPSDTCTSSSPATRYIEVTGPNSTFTRYTFGNKWQDTEGTLRRIETGSSAANILRDEALTWQTFPAPGVALAGNWLSTIVRKPETRAIMQDGVTYSRTLSNWDAYLNPQTVSESGPNGETRTTQHTYYNNRSKWIIGKPASSSSPETTTTRTFDANGNVATFVKDGVSTGYTYYLDGNIETITDPRLFVHSFSNYKRGIAQSESQPEGISITRVVSDAGFVTSETNGEGRIRSFTHDPSGRLASIDYPRGNDATAVYSGSGKTIRTVTRGGLVETSTYDALLRRVRLVQGGITTTFEYDAFGRPTFRSNPNDTLGVRWEYDSLGRLAKITNADSTYRSFEYGPASVTTHDERSHSTTSVFRAYGDPDEKFLMGITTEDPAANVTIARDADNLIGSVTQGGVTRIFDYDSRKYLISETHPEVGSIIYDRDAAGNMTARTVGSSGTTTFNYDAQNRLIETHYPGAPVVNRVYTKTHKLRSVHSTTHTRDYFYDANDNLTSEVLTTEGVQLRVGYIYNPNDQLFSITYPVSNRAVQFLPDVLGRPTAVNGYVDSVIYWPSGQIQQINYANGTTSTYGQNARLWPSSFATRRIVGSIISNSYSYDGVGNLTSIQDGVDSSYNRSFGYDSLNRLTRVDGPWGSGTIAYDGAGNISSQTYGSYNLNYTYDTRNRLASVSGARSSSYGYDVYGNISSSSGLVFSYDDAPNLRCVNCGAPDSIQYGYDGLNQRIWMSAGGTKTYEMQDLNGNLIAEYTSGSAPKLIEYMYLAGKRIAQRVVPLAASSVALSATSLNAGPEGVTLTVNVGGAVPSGTVTFYEGKTFLGVAHVQNGTAAIILEGFPLGRHRITAAYSGDAANSPKTSTVTVSVRKAASHTGVKP